MKGKILYTIAAICMMVLFTAGVPYADGTGKFQVVAGEGDQAYMVNTETGAVWILTYRTLATGREPIAIPYKFLKIKPDDQRYLFEDYQGVSIEGEFKKQKGESE